MRTTPNKADAERTLWKPANARPLDIAAASVQDTLAALHVNPDTGLTHGEVDVRRKDHGYNEVAEKRGHPIIKLLGKFWGISAWMLELIMALSAVLGKYSDLALVSAIADGLSKGVFVLGPEAGMALIKGLPGVEAVIVSAKNEVLVSPATASVLTRTSCSAGLS
jgi:magnesium-transporting ATPase (P-type)